MNILHQVNKIIEVIIGAAIEVHKSQGPGLLESTLRHVCYKNWQNTV